MKVYEEVVRKLVESDVTLFSGILGSVIAPYISEVGRQEGARYIGVRHEQVAAALLDGYARMTGNPGCLLTHGASGLLAASLGVAAAGMDSVPLMMLSGTQERVAMTRGYWQASDVLAPVAGYVKFQARVEHPEDALVATDAGLRECVSGRPGVSQLDFPIDVSTAEYEGAEVGSTPAAHTPSVRACAPGPGLTRAAEMLAAASRPVILLGGGAKASRASSHVLELAELLQAPIVLSANSRGVVPEHHPLVLGPSGILGHEPVGRLLKESDLVLGLGSRLSDMQLLRGELLGPECAVVQVNLDAGALGRTIDVDLPILADVREFTQQMAAECPRPDDAVGRERRLWAARGQEHLARWKEEWLESAPANGRLQPQEMVEALMELAPRDTIYTHGAGDHSFYGGLVPVDPPGAHLMSARLGAMGCGLGMAMGAKVARPEQTVVACLGDGEFMLQLADIETAVREQMSIIVIVFNNFSLGSQRKRSQMYGGVLGVEHGNPDFAAYARLCGAVGLRADRPGTFGSKFREALDAKGPVVIDAIVDPEARPPRLDLALASASKVSVG